jgi:hypothetical protein
MNLVVEFSDVHHTKRVAVLRDTDLACPWPDCGKGLPIVRILSMLHLMELIPSVAPGIVGESPQIVESRIYKIDILRFVPAGIHKHDI